MPERESASGKLHAVPGDKSAPFEQPEPPAYLSIQLANNTGLVVPATPEEIKRVRRLWNDGVILLEIRNRDGQWSLHNTRYIFNISPLTETMFQEWQQSMQAQSKIVRPGGGGVIQAG
jgi:hypothetical protein